MKELLNTEISINLSIQIVISYEKWQLISYEFQLHKLNYITTLYWIQNNVFSSWFLYLLQWKIILKYTNNTLSLGVCEPIPINILSDFWVTYQQGALSHQACIASPWGSSRQVLKQAPFPFPVHPCMIHQLSQVTSSAGTTLTSSIQGCLLLRQPGGKGWLLESMSHVHITWVSTDELWK